ncbi:MAG: BACON domain-containing protein [Alistipes sp.]|jgi:hypothetical protein|nr:BACON domain-containing protein [Alistipes sp.]
MKKILTLLAGALLCAAATQFTACKNEPGPDPGPATGPGELTVTPLELTFEAEGDTKTVSVEGEEWTATPSAEWIVVAQNEEGFTVTVAETDEARDGSVTVSNADDSHTVTVTQLAPGEEPDPTDTSIEVDPESLDFDFEGGNQTVTVTSELEWAVSSEQEWITATKIDDTSFEVTVTANSKEGAPAKSGSVTIDNGTETQTVAIEQGGHPGHRFVQTSGAYINSSLFPGVGIFEVYFTSYQTEQMDLWPDSPDDNGYFAYINFHTEMPTKSRQWSIPEGTYPLNPAGGKGTLQGDWWSTMDVIENGEIVNGGGGMVEGTTATVKGNGVDGYYITLNIVLDTGITLKAYYEGEIDIPNNSIRSSFFDDVDVTVDKGLLQYYGKQDGKDGYVWRMYLHDEGVSFTPEGAMAGTGFCLQTQFTSLEILNGDTLPSAIYVIKNSTEENTALYGYAGGSTGYAGMWLFELENGTIKNAAPIDSGSMTVMLSGGDFYIDMFGADDAGNDIKVRFADPLTPVKMVN